MPMSIASSPDIKNNTTKHDIGISTEDYNEIIDTLAVDSDTPIDPEDYVFNIAKIDDNGLFPYSAPYGNIQRSKSRRKKLKKKAMAIIGCTDTACQVCPQPRVP